MEPEKSSKMLQEAEAQFQTSTTSHPSFQIKALKISSSLTPALIPAQRLDTNTSGAPQDFDAPENGQHPPHSPACSFPLSLFPVTASAASPSCPSTHQDVAHHSNWEQPPWVLAQGKSSPPVLEHPKPQQDGWDEAQAT